jgi:hypothetical protein
MSRGLLQSNPPMLRLTMDEGMLRDRLRRLDPPARGAIRRVLVHDQPYRDDMARRLMRQGTEHADNLADLVDMLTLDGDRRRQVVRLLGELEAEG